MIGSLLRAARARWTGWTGADARARARLGDRRVVILNYHRVIPRAVAERDRVEQAMYVTPESFGAHLTALTQSFAVLPLHEVTRRLMAQEPLPPGACAITFDDGWLDNFEFAYPALRKAGLPATIFVVTDRVGTLGAFWPDDVMRRWPALADDRRRAVVERIGGGRIDDVDSILARMKDLDPSTRAEALAAISSDRPTPARELMGWEQLAELQSAGIDIESHSATHAILTGLDDEAVRGELVRARATLADHGLGRHGLFAYPSGRFDDRVAKIVAETGHAAAFTLEGPVAGHGCDPMRIPRFGIHDGMSRTRAEFLSKVPRAAFAFDEATPHDSGASAAELRKTREIIR